jgi:hypothetical protein
MTMKPRFTLIFVAVWACFSPLCAVSAPGYSATEQALQLANQGNVDRAIQVLRDHLGKNTKDVQARVMLGRILDFDGPPDEAVTVWEAGLTDAESDLPLLMSIGEILVKNASGRRPRVCDGHGHRRLARLEHVVDLREDLDKVEMRPFVRRSEELRWDTRCRGC